MFNVFFYRLFNKHSKKINLEIPKEVSIVKVTDGIRFRGNADQILALSKQLIRITSLTESGYAELKPYKFVVSSQVVAAKNSDNFYLPADAWGIMSAKFREVATSWEDSPFDFNNCGYIKPRLGRDIGVELVGIPYPR